MITAIIAAAALAAAASPHAVAIAPTEGAIPANTLRLYVTFDRPARGLVTTRDLHLVEAKGNHIDGAFMDFGQDLWSPDGRRLTVLFDPGRIKQDVEGAGDSAAPLQPGRRFMVELGGRHFSYLITPTLRTALNPQTWRIVIPHTGPRGALELKFDREMDFALLRDQLTVVDSLGRSLPGQVTVAANGRVWSFWPEHHWRQGLYRLVFGEGLEDISGNRIGEALDHDVGTPSETSRDRGLTFQITARVTSLR